MQANDSASDYSGDEDDDFEYDAPGDPACQADRDMIARTFQGSGHVPVTGRNHFLESQPTDLPDASTPGFEWLSAFPSAGKATAAPVVPAVAAVASSSVPAAPAAHSAAKRDRPDADAAPKPEKESDPLYDEGADEDDEKWVNTRRYEAMRLSAGLQPSNAPTAPPAGLLASLPTDAVLSCPFCFAVVTYVCQQYVVCMLLLLLLLLLLMMMVIMMMVIMMMVMIMA